MEEKGTLGVWYAEQQYLFVLNTFIGVHTLDSAAQPLLIHKCNHMANQPQMLKRIYCSANHTPRVSSFLHSINLLCAVCVPKRVHSHALRLNRL